MADIDIKEVLKRAIAHLEDHEYYMCHAIAYGYEELYNNGKLMNPKEEFQLLSHINGFTPENFYYYILKYYPDLEPALRPKEDYIESYEYGTMAWFENDRLYRERQIEAKINFLKSIIDEN